MDFFLKKQLVVTAYAANPLELLLDIVPHFLSAARQGVSSVQSLKLVVTSAPKCD